MKTTVEIADSLFAEARQIAWREGRPLRGLIEEGLRLVVGARRARRGRFRLRKATFRGQGLHPDLRSVHDARIAALCRHHGVEALCTADRDFSRFPQITVRNPLVAR
jgi:predicted nucleic acid-binding protein